MGLARRESDQIAAGWLQRYGGWQPAAIVLESADQRLEESGRRSIAQRVPASAREVQDLAPTRCARSARSVCVPASCWESLSSCTSTSPAWTSEPTVTSTCWTRPVACGCTVTCIEALTSDGHYLLSAGRVWHPFALLPFFDLQAALDDLSRWIVVASWLSIVAMPRSSAPLLMVTSTFSSWAAPRASNSRTERRHSDRTARRWSLLDQH